MWRFEKNNRQFEKNNMPMSATCEHKRIAIKDSNDFKHTDSTLIVKAYLAVSTMGSWGSMVSDMRVVCSSSVGLSSEGGLVGVASSRTITTGVLRTRSGCTII